MTASDVKVSVALCTYQGSRFIEAQLTSILTQTYPVTEVVIGDDGSTDDTLRIVHDVAAAHDALDKVKVAHRTRVGGVTANFARTLEACIGDVIALSDQDDVWHPTRVQQGLDALSAQGLPLLAAHNARLIDGEGSPLGATLHEYLRVSRVERDLFAQGRGFESLIRRNVITGACTMLRRELLDLALPLPTEWVHDEWLAVVAAAHGRIALETLPAIDYRLHGANQIGVAKPTVKARLSRMLEPRGTRLADLAVRSRILADRLSAPEIASEFKEGAAAKALFEEGRATYPSSRLTRPPKVLRNARGGTYARLSSQGALDIVRDLIQPA